METNTLKKKLSIYVSEGGYLKNVSDEVLYELLTAWEEWEGSAKEFYQVIGFSYKKMAGLLGKAKRLKREGYFGHDRFKELKVESSDMEASPRSGSHIEVDTAGKIIRFPSVDQLLEYLKKAG